MKKKTEKPRSVRHYCRTYYLPVAYILGIVIVLIGLFPLLVQ